MLGRPDGRESQTLTVVASVLIQAGLASRPIPIAKYPIFIALRSDGALFARLSGEGIGSAHPTGD
jgi:hypothetical protein